MTARAVVCDTPESWGRAGGPGLSGRGVEARVSDGLRKVQEDLLNASVRGVRPDAGAAEVPFPSDGPRVLGVKPQEQVGNGCGTTSLAMALTYATGAPVTERQVDAEIRLTDIYTSASNMRDSAGRRGIDGRLLNNLTDAEVVDALDRGRPVLFLTDMTPEDPADVARMHWRVIDGYEWKGAALQLHVVDPWGVAYWRSWSELQPYWANIKAIGRESGYNRFGIVLGANPADKLGELDRLAGVFAVEGLVDASSDVVNDVMHVLKGKFWRVVTLVVDGLRTVISLILYPLQRLFGGVDRSAGTVAKPPAAPSPPRHEGLPPPPSTKPIIVDAPPADAHVASRVRWWDGGKDSVEDASVRVRGRESPWLKDALRPPALERKDDYTGGPKVEDDRGPS